MLKWLRNEWLLAIMMLLCVAYCGLGFSLSLEGRFSQYGHANAAKPIAESIQDRAADTVAYYTEVLAWFTAVLAIVGAVQGILIFWQGVLTKRSVAISERSLVDLEGPYLYPVVGGHNFREQFRPLALYGQSSEMRGTADLIVKFQLKNYGRTIALPQTIIANLFGGEADDVFEEKADLAQSGLIGPGEVTEDIRREILNPLTYTDYLAIREGTKRIFLRGTVRFFDIFGNAYLQVFCLGYDHRTDAFTAWGEKRNRRVRLRSMPSAFEQP